MLPYRTIEKFLKFTPAELSEIVFELRNCVVMVAPDAKEEIRHQAIVYFYENLGGPVSAGICGIKLEPDHVRLYFTHGAFIEDRKGLLRGSGKAMRFVRLDHFEAVSWIDIQELIAAHANFDPRTLIIH